MFFVISFYSLTIFLFIPCLSSHSNLLYFFLFSFYFLISSCSYFYPFLFIFYLFICSCASHPLTFFFQKTLKRTTNQHQLRISTQKNNKKNKENTNENKERTKKNKKKISETKRGIRKIKGKQSRN